MKLESLVNKTNYKNVIYKMLEKYHYMKFYKKLKEILEDDKIDDKEIDDLSIHEAEHSKGTQWHLHLVDLIHNNRA